MSLQTRLSPFITALGADIKALQARPSLPVLDLVAQEHTPYFAAHRGGLSRFPEQSMVGWDQSTTDGFWPETDVYPLADGTWVCMHDATVDRTTTGTGTVTALTYNYWKALSTDGAIPGALRSPAQTWLEYLNRYGGKTVIIPEMKGSTTTSTFAQRTAWYDSIVDRGLQKSVIVQSFTYSFCLEAVARGIRALPLGGPYTAATLVADGMWGVGVANTETTANVTAYRNAGLKVMVYGGDTLANRATWLDTNGVEGLFCNDPWYMSKRWPLAVNVGETVSSEFENRTPFPGMVGNAALTAVTAAPRGEFLEDGWCPFNSVTTTFPAGTLGVPMRLAPPMSGNILIRVEVKMTGAAVGQTNWAAIFFGAMNPDSGFEDTGASDTFSNGYNFLYRRSGALDVYRIAPSTATVLLGSVTTGPIIPAGATSTVALELELTATSVIARATVGLITATNTQANTAFRGAGVGQLAAKGQTAIFKQYSIRTT